MSSSIKTAISMQRQLFDDVNALASELNVSRSKLFVLAIEAYIKQSENKKMLSQINAAFSGGADRVETETITTMKIKQKKIVEKDLW